MRDDFDRGRLSPVEVVTECLERIAEVNPTLNAHWHVAAAEALAAAKSAELRLRAGTGRPLEGVPVGIKDTIDVAGMPCTLGSRQYRDRVAAADATVVRRLREAGAIILTKDATSEFALGSPYSPLYGFTRNPWHPGHWAGGSSAGGAAGVAAGCLAGAIGTDAGGSVRAPASWSGITGLKPTKGRVSRAGIASVTWTMCTVGTMARTARDTGLILATISGLDPADPQSVAAAALGGAVQPPGLAGVSIGVCWDWAERDADAAEVAALRQTAAVLQQAGARIVTLPTPAFSEHVGRIGYHILHIEAAFALAEHRASEGLDPALVGRIDQGRFVSADSYLRALRYRVTVQQVSRS
jgi:aspartyl-tRNA(Asn)/glutamyl-tRNA(Gln) amidotransferase subunit A